MLDDSALQHLMGYRLALADTEARRVYRQHIGKPLDLRPVEFTVLLLLLTNGRATPKQLAQRLGMSPPNVTVLLDRLEQRGLLLRQRNACDGRAMDLVLTARGTTLARRAQRASETMERGLLAALTPTEHETLKSLLDRLGRSRPTAREPAA
jgi:DNA-binding MarR family transcriptional regulator